METQMCAVDVPDGIIVYLSLEVMDNDERVILIFKVSRSIVVNLFFMIKIIINVQ